MKIAHLVSTFPPYRGGIGNAAFHYARELALSGFNIEVFTPHYDTKVKFFDQESLVKVHPLSPWLKYGNAALVPQLFWKLSSFDIVHVHYPFFGGAEWTLFFKWIFVRPPKIVLSYHMDVMGEGLLRFFFKWYGKGLLPFLVRQANALIVSSRDYAETSLISRFLSQKPVYDIPYGVSPQFHPKEKSVKLMSRLSLSPSDQVILFVGGLDRAHHFKGVSILIEAMAKLNRQGVRLLIVGNGDRLPIFREQAKKSKLENQITFLTDVTDLELPDYYNLANVVVLPSVNRSEAFGIVLLEAMACGKPVIGSFLPGVRTLIEDQVNGLSVRPGDSGDLKEKIDFLLDHQSLGQQYGLAGFKKVENHFRWNQIISQVAGVYREVMGNDKSFDYRH